MSAQQKWRKEWLSIAFLFPKKWEERFGGVVKKMELCGIEIFVPLCGMSVPLCGTAVRLSGMSVPLRRTEILMPFVYFLYSIEKHAKVQVARNV